jgi:hypothetical protein
VILFAFNRREHLEQTVASLLANAEASNTHLRVYCDGPRKPADEPGVADVRDFVRGMRGFASVTPVFRDQNMGLARSIIDGVSSTLREHEHVIVLEDDLVVSPFFLRYMNDALACYREDERVASIHGYSYPTDTPLPETFFLRGADCWGWATWARAWKHFEADGGKLLGELLSRRLSHEFDYDGTYPYTSMLEDQIAQRNSSWAIRWHAACYLRGLHTLYPGRSLVHNIGNDSSGTHCEATDDMDTGVTQEPVPVGGIAIEPSMVARAAFKHFFVARLSWRQRMSSSLKRVRRALA